MIDRVCEFCGVGFRTHASQVRAGYGRFCSRSCSGKDVARRSRGVGFFAPHGRKFTQVAMECSQCGVVFRVTAGRATTAKFCSARCYRLKQGVSKGRYVHVGSGPHKTRKHRRVMEEHLGRPLFSSEHVHHRDRDRSNNRRRNLKIVSPGGHRREHVVGTVRLVGPADPSLPKRSGTY